MSEDARAVWDAEAAHFDDAPDHGLHDDRLRRTWTQLLADVLPSQASRVLDLGCGTGTLSVLLAELGHHVVGVDVSPLMVEHAERKALQHGVRVRFEVGDAAEPLVDGPFDVVLSRHVLWALPDVPAVLDRWLALLQPNGVLALIEGYWHTGSGLHAEELLPLVRSRTRQAWAQSLSDYDALWGGPVDDERFLVVGRRPSAPTGQTVSTR